MIACEDSITFRRAGIVRSWLLQNFGQKLEMNIVCWKLDPFVGRNLLEMAAADANAAHLIILSLHGDAALPYGVMEWIELWRIRGPGAVGALMALLDGVTESTKEDSPIHAYLRMVARAANMDFISETAESCDGLGRISLEDVEHIAGNHQQANGDSFDIQDNSSGQATGKPRAARACAVAREAGGQMG
ncbi:MAG: hypothetical protein HY300_02575 [Verrucomicrobia bacterium]|nr:hypothetical protein [Verrucomicrobiota bacterium]